MKRKKKLDFDTVAEAVRRDDGTGFCMSCGEEASGVEPDARNYPCEFCGEKDVFGAEEVLFMGGAT